MYEAYSDPLFTIFNESSPINQKEANPIGMYKPYIDNNLSDLTWQKHKFEKKIQTSADNL